MKHCSVPAWVIFSISGCLFASVVIKTVLFMLIFCNSFFFSYNIHIPCLKTRKLTIFTDETKEVRNKWILKLTDELCQNRRESWNWEFRQKSAHYIYIQQHSYTWILLYSFSLMVAKVGDIKNGHIDKKHKVINSTIYKQSCLN